jgi:putative secretion ATPase (PEP-CTERM system associated)
MHISFFGLKSVPFQLTPDPEFLFLSKVHKKALTYLNYGITDNSGFILITGEVGTGKTTVIRSMMKRLKEDVIFSRINNTRLTSEQLISMINEDFGLDIKGKDKTQMLRDLTDFLIKQYGKGRKSILIIDEAQNLSTDLLEEIRLLSNLETDKSKLLQIILIGQPELRKVLAKPDLRALRQRINISCHISPLLRNETEEYIFHRLEIAGNREAVSFQDGCIDLIHNFARGVPRLINIACDFLLLSAFVDKTKEVSLDMVKEVISDLERDNRYWQDETFISSPIPLPQGDGVRGMVLREVPEISENTKESPLKRGFDYAEKTEIFEKISETAGQFSAAIDSLKMELTNRNTTYMDKKLNNIEKEVRELKEITSEIKKGGEEKEVTKDEKKKNLWARIFSYRRLL